jgi:hypothetical protein
MCADVAIHDKGTGNPHVHILLPTRDVGVEGFSIKNREWDKRSNVTIWRREWANTLNRELDYRGIDKVSHESFIARGIDPQDREPQIHQGRRVKMLLERGIETDRGNKISNISSRNKERKEQEIQQERSRGGHSGHDRSR